jgi:hypothetical protein
MYLPIFSAQIKAKTGEILGPFFRTVDASTSQAFSTWPKNR